MDTTTPDPIKEPMEITFPDSTIQEQYNKYRKRIANNAAEINKILEPDANNPYQICKNSNNGKLHAIAHAVDSAIYTTNYMQELHEILAGEYKKQESRIKELEANTLIQIKNETIKEVREIKIDIIKEIGNNIASLSGTNQKCALPAKPKESEQPDYNDPEVFLDLLEAYKFESKDPELCPCCGKGRFTSAVAMRGHVGQCRFIKTLKEKLTKAKETIKAKCVLVDLPFNPEEKEEPDIDEAEVEETPQKEI